jgi:hypothetical protein
MRQSLSLRGFLSLRSGQAPGRDNLGFLNRHAPLGLAMTQTKFGTVLE